MCEWVRVRERERERERERKREREREKEREKERKRERDKERKREIVVFEVSSREYLPSKAIQMEQSVTMVNSFFSFD